MKTSIENNMPKGPIKLSVTDETYKALRRSLNVAKICRQLSAPEQFVQVLLNKMKDGKEEWNCSIKSDPN
ncbi:MAG: hypothetical protein HN929_12645 [Chloroflexi bacterium]|jgi:hypothetical protein|nr:hypothetical protein [Chloroflexota bacterium]